MCVCWTLYAMEPPKENSPPPAFFAVVVVVGGAGGAGLGGGDGCTALLLLFDTSDDDLLLLNNLDRNDIMFVRPFAVVCVSNKTEALPKKKKTLISFEFRG